MVEEALEVAALYTSKLHTGLEDVLPYVARFKSNLEEKSTDQIWNE